MRLKTTALKALLVALLVLLSSSPTSGASTGNYIWISHGPGGGLILALAIDPHAPSTVYAGTYGGGVFAQILTPYSLYLPILKR